MARAVPPTPSTVTPPAPPEAAVPTGVHHHTITPAEWEAIARDAQFRELIAEKKRVIVPATIFFIIYYFALPVLVGYVPQVMQREVIGHINWAYLFALSQFFVAWAIAFWYLAKAGVFDEMARRIRERITGGAA